MNKQHKKFDISKMTEFKPSNKSVEDQYDQEMKEGSEEEKEARKRQTAPFSSID